MLTAFATVLAVAAAAQPSPSASGPARGSSNVAVINDALVTLIEDPEVSAQEPGLLVEVAVREGAMVKAGDVLARIDDSQAQSAKEIADFEQQAATEKANNDVEVRYAVAATEVANAEYEKALQSERRVRSSIGEAELNRLKLTAKRSELQIEQAEVQRVIDGLTAKTKGAEAKAAERNIERRLIKAPIDGIVVSVNAQVGEWVQPGDIVIHVIRVDKLRVEGYANVAQYSAAELRGKPVRVQVKVDENREPVVFEGVVTFVDPRVQLGGDYRVFAEVANRQENGEWLLRSGLNATMAIDTAAQSATAAAATRQAR